ERFLWDGGGASVLAWVCALSLLLLVRRQRPALACAPALLLYASFYLVYMATPEPSVRWHVSLSAGRLLLQGAALIVLGGVLALLDDGRAAPEDTSRTAPEDTSRTALGRATSSAPR